MADAATILKMAKAAAGTNNYNTFEAANSTGPTDLLNLILFQEGYLDGSDLPDATLVPNDQVAHVAFYVAYLIVLNVIDLTKTGIKEVKDAADDQVKFNDMLAHLIALAKRLAIQAGVNENAVEQFGIPTDILKVPFFD